MRSILLALTVATGLVAVPVTNAAPVAQAAPASASVFKQLNGLQVKGRGPKTGYSRAMFGPAWTDNVSVAYGRNGCDTRNDILRRDLVNKRIKPGTRNCIVTSGVLNDPYTGKSINFVRGSGTSSRVQIDHVVALSDAWQKGAMFFSPDKRTRFANDPLNLRAVSGTANQRKGAGDAATWLPSNKSFRCTYVTSQVRVKAKYGLSVTSAEKSAMRRVLLNCTRPNATPRPNPAPSPKPNPAPAPKPRPQPAPQPEPSPTYFQNCSAARAAGAAPIYRGQPGYRSALDRDNDGVACE